MFGRWFAVGVVGCLLAGCSSDAGSALVTTSSVASASSAASAASSSAPAATSNTSSPTTSSAEVSSDCQTNTSPSNADEPPQWPSFVQPLVAAMKVTAPSPLCGGQTVSVDVDVTNRGAIHERADLVFVLATSNGDYAVAQDKPVTIEVAPAATAHESVRLTLPAVSGIGSLRLRGLGAAARLELDGVLDGAAPAQPLPALGKGASLLVDRVLGRTPLNFRQSSQFRVILDQTTIGPFGFGYQSGIDNVYFELMSLELEKGTGSAGPDAVCASLDTYLTTLVTDVGMLSAVDVVHDCVVQLSRVVTGGSAGQVGKVDISQNGNRFFASWSVGFIDTDKPRLLLNVFWNPTDEQLTKSE
jgi:hypothetical protein